MHTSTSPDSSAEDSFRGVISRRIEEPTEGERELENETHPSRSTTELEETSYPKLRHPSRCSPELTEWNQPQPSNMPAACSPALSLLSKSRHLGLDCWLKRFPCSEVAANASHTVCQPLLYAACQTLHGSCVSVCLCVMFVRVCVGGWARTNNNNRHRRQHRSDDLNFVLFTLKCCRHLVRKQVSGLSHVLK